MGLRDEDFNIVFDNIKKENKVKQDVDMDAAALKKTCRQFLSVVEQKTGKPFPQDPYVQLDMAVEAVFGSWMGKRAIDYRREFKITKEMANGTAVNICTMVFGNMGNDSATGVAFTRDPANGENRFFGEYLINAQGEDVVAGIRTPHVIRKLRREMPDVYPDLMKLRLTLEKSLP